MSEKQTDVIAYYCIPAHSGAYLKKRYVDIKGAQEKHPSLVLGEKSPLWITLYHRPLYSKTSV